jgi:hypothetical protein
MTRRRLGWIRVTAVCPVMSDVARTRRWLIRQPERPGAGWCGGFRQDVASYQDNLAVAAVAEAVR